MDYPKAYTYVLKLLENELPDNLYYHGLHHTLDVFRAAERLAKAEGMDEHMITVIKTAALYHDLGFVVQYKNNEPIAAQMARDTLPDFNYDKEDIEIIANCILATQVPQKAQTLPEMIVCDADLDYLGREDFLPIAHTLRREWIENGFFGPNLKDWYGLQVKFLSAHNFYTETAKKTRQPTKQFYLNQIKDLLCLDEKQETPQN